MGFGWIGRGIDRIVDRAARRWHDRWAEREFHPGTLLARDAQREAAAFIREHMAPARVVPSRNDVLRAALAAAPADGMILEFGVAEGDSIRFLAGLSPRPMHGFDSFEGLPADWPGRHEGAGHYSTGGRLPAVPAHVTLHKGWFDQTLPPFLGRTPGPVALLHVDCDLYASTRVVLDGLADRIVAGTVILFDEFFNFPSWRDHEFKAFHEFAAAREVRYTYLCAGFQQAVLRIDAIAPAKNA